MLVSTGSGVDAPIPARYTQHHGDGNVLAHVESIALVPSARHRRRWGMVFVLASQRSGRSINLAAAKSAAFTVSTAVVQTATGTINSTVTIVPPLSFGDNN